MVVYGTKVGANERDSIAAAGAPCTLSLPTAAPIFHSSEPTRRFPGARSPSVLSTRCCVLESLATDCAAPMHIKYVVVEGFRVYRDRIELAPLSPKHNVVGEPPDPPRSTPRAPYATAHPELPCCAVGANGAGKSNLFNGACRRIGRSLPPTPAPAHTEAHARAVRWQPSSLSWAT